MAEIMFERFCDVLEELFRKKKSKPDQEKILCDFINEIKNKLKLLGRKECSLYPVIRLLLPNLERERSAYNLKETKLGSLLVKVLSLPKMSPDAQKLLNYKSVKNSAEGSDFASVAYFIMNNRLGQKTCTLTIGDINDTLDKIAAAEVGNKGPILVESFTYIINNMTAKQAKWFLRIVVKDLKLAIGKTKLLSAIHPDAPEMYETCSSLMKVCEEYDEGNTRLPELGVVMFLAVCPMMSERLDVTRMEGLPEGGQYFLEEKFDGERFQIHMKDGIFEYFSRKGFSYSDKYGRSYDSNGFLTPLLKHCWKPGVDSFVLDGEMMGWHKQHERFGCKGLSYDIKKVTENSKYRPCFCAFDILYYNGRSLIGYGDKGGVPLHERLELLDGLFTDVKGVIHHSRRISVNNASEVLQALNRAIDKTEEGIVLKERNSYYIANRRNAGWYKIKPEYSEGSIEDLDLVIIGANYAENKKQGLANSFFVACADGLPESPSRRWISIGRVSTGLSFEERESVCELLSRRWKVTSHQPPPDCLLFNRDLPDFWILPEHSIVLTVRASELVLGRGAGTTHALRFPRVLRLRPDKPAGDVLTLAEFNKLVADKGPVVKLSNKRIKGEDMEVSEVKPSRKRKSKLLQFAENFQSKHQEIQTSSKALEGRKVCVLSDDECCSKGELENLILSHGGIVVQDCSSSTWLSVCGRINARVKNRIRSNAYDIVPSSWLRSLPVSDRPCPPPSPLHLIAMSRETREIMARDYDPYGDSYRELVSGATLRLLFEKMERENLPVTHLTKKEMLNLDKELFGDVNPLSFLRGCSIHVPDDRSLIAIKARMFGATLCPVETPGLTHVVLAPTTAPEVLEDIKGRVTALVVSNDWLEMCFKTKQMSYEGPFAL